MDPRIPTMTAGREEGENDEEEDEKEEGEVEEDRDYPVPGDR